MIRRIAILGEIGSRNLGDDLGFIIIRDALMKRFRDRDVHAQIECFTPARFGDLDHGTPGAVLTGVGTLLDGYGGAYMKQLRKMQKRKIPTAIIGSGMSDLDHLPNTDDGSKLSSEMFESKYLKVKAVRGVDGPDAFYSMGWQGGKHDREVIGINMGYAAFTRVPINEIFRKVRATWDFLKANGHEVQLVSCWLNDNPWFRSAFPNEKILQVDGSRKSIEELGRLKAIVSFRGHLGVMAAMCGLNVFPIIFSTKVPAMYARTTIDYKPLEVGSEDWPQYVQTYAYNGNDQNETAVKKACQQINKKIDEFVDEII